MAFFQNEISSLNDIFYSASILPTILRKYTDLLCADLLRKNKNSQTENLPKLFYDSTHYPFFFIHKILNAAKRTYITNNNNNTNNTSNTTTSTTPQQLTVTSVVHYLADLMTSSDLKIRLSSLFKLFDFDNDNIVHLEDIMFLIEHFYTIKFKTAHYLDELKEILNDSSLSPEMNLDKFISIIESVNSDIFYLFFLLVNRENFFSKKYLEIFVLHNHFNSKSQFSFITICDNNLCSSSVIAPASDKMINFVKDFLNDNTFNTSIISEDNDLDILEDFEQSVSSALESIDIQNEQTFVIKPKAINKFDLTMATEEDTLRACLPNKWNTMDKKKVNTYKKNVNDIDKQFIVQLDAGYGEAKMRMLVSGETTKVRIIIKNKMLFVKEKTRKDLWKIRNIYSLVNIFSYISSEVYYNSEDMKKYYQLVIISNSDERIQFIRLLTSKHDKANLLLSLILTNINHQDIHRDYVFGKEINKGSFGIIYLGQDRITKQKVAIKRISKEILHNGAIWEKEIFTIIQVKQPEYFVKCIRIYEDLAHVYLIYEYLEHGTLRMYLKEHYSNTSSDYTKRILPSLIKQLVSAVYFMNTNGIIHRDLKPDNLLMNYSNGDYEIKVTDFGLGKILSPNEYTSEPFGSLVYSAPEILKMDAYTYEPDVWSTGMIVYFILLNDDPFIHFMKTSTEIKKIICNVDCRSLLYQVRECDKNAVDIMKECLLEKGKRISIRDLYKKVFGCNKVVVHNNNEIKAENL